MRCLILLATLPMAFASPAAAQEDTADSVMVTYLEKTQAVRPCPRDPGAIVVCGNRRERNARERIPLLEEREPGRISLVRGEAPRASAVRVKMGSCGIIASESAGCNGGIKLLSFGRPDPSNRQSSILHALAPTLNEEEPDFALKLPNRYKGATPP